MNIKAWIQAARLRTLPLAASCSLAGTALALDESTNLWPILLLALLTTFLLQILSNFANDYGDYSHGVDNAERVGPERALQSGAITKKQMRYGLIICAVFAFMAGISLLWVSLGRSGLFYQALLFLAIGMAAITAAFKYTMGKNPYGYRGLGDLFVFLFFGIVGVCGTYYLHTKNWNNWILLPATAVGALSTAVLNLNNLRDHENDAATGKKTMVVILGFERGKIYQLILVTTAFISSLLWMIRFNINFVEWIPLFALLIPLILLVKVFKTQNPADLDSELKKVALSTFLYSLTFLIVQLA